MMLLNYHDLLVAAIVGSGLAVYILFMIGWCVYQQLSHQEISQQRDQHPEDEASDADCVICLLGFEDGEDLQQLPRCNHSFHAPCINMWLYSHSDCPLCREPLEEVASEGNYP
ncbi:RING-H2 finger protein ATL52 [Vitis vinifera]|uniref:RING-H2 finger protein ATL52 n=1 Tax=Vitis vinifera TaxID=29760 RepID=A0A438EWH6_VITVI|nr:RING-H2 finger protein ATL52 [Vitis vinifera]